MVTIHHCEILPQEIFGIVDIPSTRKMVSFWENADQVDSGPIFLRRFKLYMFSFTFEFMFANICFEKNKNSKIFVMFIIKNNMKIRPVLSYT